VKALAAARERLVLCTEKIAKALRDGDPHFAFLVATPYLRLFGDVACAALLLEQALLALGKLGPGDLAAHRAKAETDASSRFYYDKLCTAQFFVYNHLPRVAAYAETILSGDRSALDTAFPRWPEPRRPDGFAMPLFPLAPAARFSPWPPCLCFR